MKDDLQCFEITWYKLTCKCHISLDLMGRMNKTVFCAMQKCTVCNTSLQQNYHPSMFPTAFPYCCRWYQRARQKETDFTFSKLHLSFFHLFSAYLLLLFRPPSRRKIKEQYGKTKEITRMFYFKETFFKTLCFQMLPFRF